MASVKQCILVDDKQCNSCGECDRCDMNPSAPCTNCGVCLALADFRAIEVTDILFQQEGPGSKSSEIFEDHEGAPLAIPVRAAHESGIVRKPLRLIRRFK